MHQMPESKLKYTV